LVVKDWLGGADFDELDSLLVSPASLFLAERDDTLLKDVLLKEVGRGPLGRIL